MSANAQPNNNNTSNASIESVEAEEETNQRMDVEDAFREGSEQEFQNASSDMSDSDGENADYSEVFQRLVNGYINGTSHPKLYTAPRIPKFKHKQDTNTLKRSDFYLMTKQSSGMMSTAKRRNINHYYGKLMPGNDTITAMLSNRERGLYANGRFSPANKCRISNWFLPNTMRTLCSYNGKVFCGIFSNDGKYFMTASQDQYIRIYEVTNCGRYQHANTIKGLDIGWSLIDVAFSPNNQHFIYTTWSPTLHLCEINGETEKQTPLKLVKAGRRFCVFSVQFSPTGKEILGGANDGFMYIYDLQRNDRTHKIQAHEYDINTVCFADETSQILFSGGDDGLIKVWDRRTLGDDVKDIKPVGILAGHMDGITFIDSKKDGKHLISNSKDQTIKLWDIRCFSTNKACHNTIKATHSQTWDYRWQGVPKKVYKKERLEGDSSVMTYRGHIVTRTLIRCRFSPLHTTGQRFIYTGCGNGRLVIYDALSGRIKVENGKHAACVRDIDWHPYRNEILTSSWDGTVGLWNHMPKNSCEELDNENDHIKYENIRRSIRLAMKSKS